MASLPDALFDESVNVTFGYFSTKNFYKISPYLNELLLRYGRSFYCDLHVSLWLRNEIESVEIEFHMPRLETILVQAGYCRVDIDRLMKFAFYDLTDTVETCEGWSMLTDSLVYWIKTTEIKPPVDSDERNSFSANGEGDGVGFALVNFAKKMKEYLWDKVYKEYTSKTLFYFN